MKKQELGSETADPTRRYAANAETAQEYYPPDVGLLAWLQVVGGFFLFFNCWGVVLSYGAYQSYYTSTNSFPAYTQSDISWIGSIQSFLLLFGGALCGRPYDAGYLRTLVTSGGILMVVGQMTSSLAKQYWQVLLSQGVCVGLGCGCLLVPSLAAGSTWFVKRRGQALACITTGAAIGGAVFPIATQRLIAEIGFSWAIRVSGFITLASVLISLALLRPRLPPRKRGALFEIRALGEPEILIYSFGMFCTMSGFYVFFNYVQDVSLPWAQQTDISFGDLDPFYLLPIMNAASIPGRTLPTILSDIIGPLNIQAPFAVISGILAFSWLAVFDLSGLLAVCITYAVASGAFLALPPAAVASLTPDLSRFGARMGVILAFMSLGSLVGNPVSGAIIQSSDGGTYYAGAKLWAGCTLVGGGALIWTSRMILSRRKGVGFLVKI